jgi:hypothetical protein
MFTNWPTRELPGLAKTYILAQWAFWLQQLLVIHSKSAVERLPRYSSLEAPIDICAITGNPGTFGLAQPIRKYWGKEATTRQVVFGDTRSQSPFTKRVVSTGMLTDGRLREYFRAQGHFLERPVDHQCPKQFITPSGDIPMTSQSSIAVQFESIS